MLCVSLSVDVTLDPDSAHPKLFLSDDGKQVRHGDKRQNLPDKPERFDRSPCVLGKEGFSSGRFYYEVQDDVSQLVNIRHLLVKTCKYNKPPSCQSRSGLMTSRRRDEGDHKTHSTVPIEEESGEKKTQLGKTQAEVQQMIQDRLKKIDEMKESVEINKKSREKEKADSVEVFRALLRCIERSQAELLEVYSSLSSPPHTKNWTDIRINTHLRVETLRRALTQLQEELSKEMEKLDEIVDVTLDPDTGNPFLSLSDDRKQVTCRDTELNLPNTPERFDDCVCVLGKEGFSSGRFYYEVQVREKTDWTLGVTTESSNRKGEITLSPEDGYWIVVLRNETEYTAADSAYVRLFLKQAPQKVGVFVDYEEGLVSFYDVVSRSHIYSFTGQSFTEKLYPYFSPSDNGGDKNSAPLIITPVKPHK
ncbi:hypothetical protein MHYP_G00015490 [Metynnis hypsauchen]